MEQNKIAAKIREKTGKGFARRLRAQGVVPGVLYGREAGNLALELEAKDLERVIAASGMSAVVKVDIQGKPYTAVIREIQHHPVRGDIIHCDLFQVPETGTIQTAVGLHLTGEPAGVKAGGILQHHLREVEIQCLVSQIPEAITADVSALEVGDNLKAGDLTPPPGVKIVTDPETVVATVVAPRVTEQAEEQAQGEAEEIPGEE